MKKVVVCLGVLLALTGCARDEPRPSGVAERWLSAVNDQGRDNLRDKSIKRAEQYGDQPLVGGIVPSNAAEDERWFSDFEVGKAIVNGGTARVPLRITVRLEGDKNEEVTGTAVLTKVPGSWRVTNIDDRGPGERAPSEGGARPASANAGQWLGTVVLGLAIMAVSSLVIRAQPRAAGGPASQSTAGPPPG